MKSETGQKKKRKKEKKNEKNKRKKVHDNSFCDSFIRE